MVPIRLTSCFEDPSLKTNSKTEKLIAKDIRGCVRLTFTKCVHFGLQSPIVVEKYVDFSFHFIRVFIVLQSRN